MSWTGEPASRLFPKMLTDSAGGLNPVCAQPATPAAETAELHVKQLPLRSALQSDLLGQTGADNSVPLDVVIQVTGGEGVEVEGRQPPGDGREEPFMAGSLLSL